MTTDALGIVLRETKTAYGRRMILLFTREHGVISAGTNINERSKSKSAHALQHFTYGRYALSQKGDSYFIDRAEIVKSHFDLSQNLEKFLKGAYVLEFTSKVLQPEAPMPGVFDMLVEFFDMLEEREKGFGTLVLAYQTRLFAFLGIPPVLDRCALCGKPPGEWFSVADGGLICDGCRSKILAEEGENSARSALIYAASFDIINALKYFNNHSLKRLDNIALSESTGKRLQTIIREYAAYHLDVSNIKSESIESMM